ncbi:hypothetical protein [Xanthomonas arboricola]|uniref:hypothetical protein n=1 Tax=Xanthomonas arboricola TaxID=56448 RepID=UPI0011AFD524|nr:hypothetical protein [Xanthomonas arboricola]
MNRYIEKSLHEIAAYTKSATENEERIVSEILEALVTILASRPSSVREDTLKKIERYVGQRARGVSENPQTPDQLLLEVLRSKSSTRLYSEHTLRRIHAPFWKTLEKVADSWHPSELTHLLSYAMHAHVLNETENKIAPKTVVGIYRQYFKDLRVQERDAIFRYLLDMFSAEPNFRRAVRDNEVLR